MWVEHVSSDEGIEVEVWVWSADNTRGTYKEYVMDWKVAWKATWILLLSLACLGIVIVTGPWSIIVLFGVCVWVVVYCAVLDGQP